MMMEEGKEDERREAAIASTPYLQSNFKSTGITCDQLSKFQELHRRRLQIKSSSKIQNKIKDKTSKSRWKNPGAKDHGNKSSCASTEDSIVSTSKSNNVKDNSSLQKDNGAAQIAAKKRQKLHWGLDTKERWERKANM